MTPRITVVIAVLNEPYPSLHATVKSIRDTAGDYAQVILVDDCSSAPVQAPDKWCKVIHNKGRMGCAASRHIGVMAAETDKILLTDAHMRFHPDWLPPTLGALECSDRLLICGQCVGIDRNNMDPSRSKKIYNGARFVVHNPEEEPRYRVLTCKWADSPDKRDKDRYQLSGVMGALYGFHKSWFVKIGGLHMLRGWGGDEEHLSLKTLRCGGEIRMVKGLRAAHVFRLPEDKVPYPLNAHDHWHNMLLLALTACPATVSSELINSVGTPPGWQRALDMISEANGMIFAEQARLPVKRSWEETVALINSIG